MADNRQNPNPNDPSIPPAGNADVGRHASDREIRDGERVVPTTNRDRPARTVRPTGATAVEENTPEPEPVNEPNQEAWIGTDRPDVSQGNTSWGGIIAGVFTFIALVILLALGAAALGLQDAGGWALGLWTLIGLAIAFFAAGYVTGVLGVRSGLFNGFLTWATSLVTVLFLTGLLGTSLISGVTNALGGVADTAAQVVDVQTEEVQGAADEAGQAIDQEDVDQAQQQASELADEAQQTAQEIAPQASAGIWWTLLGLVVGAVLSAVGGGVGARSVVNKRYENETRNARR